MLLRRLTEGDTQGAMRYHGVPNMPVPPPPPPPKPIENFLDSPYCSKEYPYVPRTLENLCVPIGDIKPDPRNPRVNSKTAKDLAKLIKRYGFRKAVVLDQNNMLRAGHTAVKAAEILKMTHVPTTLSEFDAHQSVGYMISDNAIGEQSDWDNDLLIELMKAGGIDEREKSGFSKTRWKKFKLVDELPPEMQTDKSITASGKNPAEFIVITFPDTESKEKFKNVFDIRAEDRAIALGQLAQKAELLTQHFTWS